MKLIKISAIFVYFEILKYKSLLIKITSSSDSVFSFKYKLYNL